MKSIKQKAMRWAKSAKRRRRQFRPEYLEIRDAALWARMRLDDPVAWRETLDQQKALREQRVVILKTPSNRRGKNLLKI